MYSSLSKCNKSIKSNTIHHQEALEPTIVRILRTSMMLLLPRHKTISHSQPTNSLCSHLCNSRIDRSMAKDRINRIEETEQVDLLRKIDNNLPQPHSNLPTPYQHEHDDSQYSSVEIVYQYNMDG